MTNPIFQDNSITIFVDDTDTPDIIRVVTSAENFLDEDDELIDYESETGNDLIETLIEAALDASPERMSNWNHGTSITCWSTYKIN